MPMASRSFMTESRWLFRTFSQCDVSRAHKFVQAINLSLLKYVLPLVQVGFKNEPCYYLTILFNSAIECSYRIECIFEEIS